MKITKTIKGWEPRKKWKKEFKDDAAACAFIYVHWAAKERCRTNICNAYFDKPKKCKLTITYEVLED